MPNIIFATSHKIHVKYLTNFLGRGAGGGGGH